MTPHAGHAVSRVPRLLLASLGAMSLLAWLALGQSGGWLHAAHHQHLGGLTRSTALVDAAMFVSGWTVMTVAMMLPTALPLVGVFGIVIRDRPNRTSLTAVVTAGYLAIWTAAGVLAFALVALLREATTRFPWAEANPWVIASVASVTAGAFQFSSIKYACLDKCRSILGFVTEHWSGTHELRAAFGLGVHHGLFCIGCCWALMLLMVVVGAGHLAWMLVLGIVMALEKNVSWGRAIVRPVGTALVIG